jgi:anti-sigma factor RsiW
MTGNIVTCQQFVEIVTAYWENALPDDERVAFEQHLAECPYCQDYLDQMRQTVVIVGRLSEETLADDEREMLLACFREWTRA